MNNRFIKIVRNYEKVVKIGKDIIRQKESLNNVQHELMIDKFIKEIDKANQNWKNNTSCIYAQSHLNKSTSSFIIKKSSKKYK
jgi:predicted GNAT family N-acyltransferase